MRKTLALACLLTGMASGCSMMKDTVKVVKNPDASDDGIRYYRPKPYLLVTPADPTGRLVNMKIEYHPDFSEEYSIHPRGKKTQVALKEGWNLTGVNVGPPPPPEDKAPPPPAAAAAASPAVPDMVVAASNVPLGYYESVIGVANGQKYFQGWRYIGFSVVGKPGINPTYPPVGSNPNCPPPLPTADLGNAPLYGLVFFNGVQTFRQVNEIAANQLCPTYVPPFPKPVAFTGPATVPSTGTTVESNSSNPKETTIDPGGAQPPQTPKPPTPAPPAPDAGGTPRPKPKPDDTAALLLNLPPLPRP